MSLVNAGPELLAAKERLASYQNNITVFGSARIKDQDPLYQKAYELVAVNSSKLVIRYHQIFQFQ